MTKRQPIARATAAVVPLTAKKSKTQSPGRDDAPPVQLATPGRSTDRGCARCPRMRKAPS
jgi:hypothetical protein